ncbi:MAG: ATP-binding protein, partial [Spirochaetota bacterium]
LLTDVFSFHPDADVKLTVEMDDVSLPSDTATTLGLVLNEIATNAIKHGFATGLSPSFRVSMERSEAPPEYLMTVSQSGRPLPDDVELSSSRSSGLGLIHELVTQLKGSVDVQRHPSPTFTIRVPIEPADG